MTTTDFGVRVGGGLSVTGNVSIGGTLTYEDVTNIDSLGIVTARSGVISPYADIDDFISVGSNIHLGNAGVCTATTFSGSGASLTNLNASNIASGTVPIARIGTGTKNTTTFFRGDGTFQVVNTDLVSDTSPNQEPALDTNGSNINFGDSTSNGNNVNRLRFGTGTNGDLEIYHDGSNSYLQDRGTGGKNTSAEVVRIQDTDSAENMGVFNKNGSVDLYENNTLKFRTGVTGDYGSVQLQNGKNGWYGVSCNGQTVFMSDGNDIGLYNDTDNEWILKGTRNGEVQLRYNDSIKFQTTSSGATVTGVIQTNNTPNADYAGFHAKSSGSGNHCGFFADSATGANAQTHIRFGYSGNPRWQWRVPWHAEGTSYWYVVI